MPGQQNAHLARGRECYARLEWSAAFDALAAADHSQALGADDLECLAMAAYLVGRDEDYLNALDRAHQTHVDTGLSLRAARCAFFLGLRLMFRGEAGRAAGWFARGQRLVERESCECVEQGYLLIPAAMGHFDAQQWDRADACLTRAMAVGERFGDPDLLACTQYLQGRVRIAQGNVAPGLTLLDEAMVTVAGGTISPLMTGLIYCGVIEACQEVYAVSRSREWTLALSEWCARQPEMVSFTGTCLVHRAEILQQQGAWHDAIAEARRACDRCLMVANQRAAAAAHYQCGEVHRLRGEFVEAEEAYGLASRGGCDPQPGLALMRLAQGRPDAAAAAIRRVESSHASPPQRAKILPAYVEIMLAVGDVEAARKACVELDSIAASFGAEMLAAAAAYSRGALELAEGHAVDALGSLRQAWHVWQDIDAPYLAARARTLLGAACRALGDDDGAELEFAAAHATLERLHAAPDLTALESLRHPVASGRAHNLTARELQVLRLVASGKTNKHIANDLLLSEKTVDRHVSNILAKLNVSSRAAATACAFRDQLL